jgi:hypothetical protein
MMGKIKLKSFVPKDDPMFKQGPTVFSRIEGRFSSVTEETKSGDSPKPDRKLTQEYRVGVRGAKSITEDVLLDAAQALIKGDLCVRKQQARRYIVLGTDGPIIRDLTGAQLAEFMVATCRYYTKNGSIHMGQRFLFCNIKKRDLLR